MANGNNKIGFIVEEREFHSNGVVKVSVRMLNSDKPELTTNELPIILNALKRSHLVDEDVQIGFDYTLDFAMAEGIGFPYVLEFGMVEGTDLNIT